MRTLAQLRTAVLSALGFITVLGANTATMGTLRQRIRAQLGLADPIGTLSARTLTEIRTTIMHRLGWGAQVLSPPSGVTETLAEFINEAQAVLFRRLELDLGAGTMPTRMGSGDACTVDAPLLTAYASAMAATHFGKPEAKALWEEANRMLADELQRNPPGIEDLITAQLIEAQHTAYRRYAQNSGSTFSLNTFAADGDATTIDHIPVYLLALANLKARLKQDDAKAYFEQYETYYRELERRMPANAATTVTALLQSAHETLYRRYPLLMTERFFSWTLVAGENMYELNENDEQDPGPSQCLITMDPRKITAAHIEREGVWYPLIKGIPPEMYSNNIVSNIPSRYEIRQCIELWPSPGTETQILRMKAHGGLESFSADADEPSIDDEPLYLLAVANAKDVFNQKGGQMYTAMLEAYIANCVAGLHQTARYLPGGVQRGDYVMPQPSVPFS